MEMFPYSTKKSITKESINCTDCAAMVLFISTYLFYSFCKSLILLRMMKVILLTLGALSLLTLINAPEVLKTISLVRRIGTINVAKSTRDWPLLQWLSIQGKMMILFGKMVNWLFREIKNSVIYSRYIGLRRASK